MGAQFNEMCSLQSGLREQNTVISDNTNRVAMNSGETTNQHFVVHLLEFIELTAIYDSGDNLIVIL